MEEHPPERVVLAGDEDRDRSAQALTAAVVEGRLTLEEFSQRVGIAHAARTRQELARLTEDLPEAAVPAALATAPQRHRAICSRLVRSGPLELAARSELRCICGTIELDLSQARLAGPAVELRVFNFCGTVTILVPEGVDVSVTGGGMFASQVIEPPSQAPMPNAPRLTIDLAGPCGTTYVRSPGRAEPSGADRALTA